MVIAGGLVLGAGLALGARCIERTSVHVDTDGYTHITGEMVNDTDIQGTNIMVQGTLFDGDGNAVAQKTAPTCPPDLQPHSEILYDIRFDNPSVPPFVRYEVRPISGRAIPAPLIDPDVVILETEAIRFQGVPPIPGLRISDKDVLFEFGARNRSGHTYGVQGCAAVYDSTGAVSYVISTEIVQIDHGVPVPATLDSTEPVGIFMLARNVPTGPVQVRAWLWFGDKGAPTSPYQFVMTPFITIQTRTLP